MLKNKDGYFLTEAIIAITIVATAITVLYVNIINNYNKQNNELTKYNTVDGLYCAKEIKKYFLDEEETFKNKLQDSDYINIFDDNDEFLLNLDVKDIYFTIYNYKNTGILDEFPTSIKKELNNLTIEDNKCLYRYIIVFNDNSYSTIGIDCN